MEWVVIKWNKPALDFYKTLGAVEMDEFVSVLVLSDYAYTPHRWQGMRLTGKNLAALEHLR